MDILVCIKQVPGTSKVEVDPVTGVLKRDGIDSKMNPYDLFALETAFRIRAEKRWNNKSNQHGTTTSCRCNKRSLYDGCR